MESIGLFPSFGSFFLNTAAFIVALTVIVAVHEFGHYIIGRWSGIHAEVFSLGFGPRLYSRIDKRGTRWQIAAIPLGGYVKFLGDADAASGAPDEETLSHMSVSERRHTLHGAPLWARAATVAAGPVFNFILSIVVFAGIFLSSGIATDVPTIGSLKPLPGGVGGLVVGDEIVAIEGVATPDFETLSLVSKDLPSQETLNYSIRREGGVLEVDGPALYPPLVDGVTPDSAAIDAGLKRGDVLTAVDGTAIHTITELQKAVAASDGAPLAIDVWREDSAPISLNLTPRRTDLPKAEGGFETRWLIGISGGYFFTPATRDASLPEALKGAVRQSWNVASSSLSGLYHIVTGRISSCNLRGPIGIAESSGAAASQGVVDFIWFLAALSTAIGLLNLFPIPVLDGGHLMFHAWEWATGKPPSERFLRMVMGVGLVLVLSLMVFGLTNDLFC